MAGNATKNARLLKIAVLTIFILCIAVSFFAHKVQAYVAPYPLEYECRALSNTDILEGSFDEEGKEYTLKNYIDGVNDGSLYYETALQPNYYIK